MKTIPLFPILLLSACTAMAEELTSKIDGFLDVPWGATEDAVKKNFPPRSHARLDQVKSAPGKLRYIGGKFAKLKARSFYLEFVNDHFWMATVIFDPQSKDHSKEYAAVKQMLTEKYGPPLNEAAVGLDHVANWYVGEGPQEKDRIELHSQSREEGLRIMYASDRLRKSLSQPQAATVPPAPATAAKPKSPPASATGAKDDL